MCSFDLSAAEIKMTSVSDNIIFHIDVNSAFLSWSAIKLLNEGSPLDIRTVPAIVGGNQETRHGIVVAKSIPAKRYGIHTADTVASAFKKCPQLISVPPDHTYYRQMSSLLMERLSDICPVIEQVSVDECYMDFEPIRKRFGSAEAAALYIKNGIKENLGFTVNIGISDRKVLAKMASDFEKPDKIHTLYASEIQSKLWPLSIGELYMCGKSTAEHFKRLGIKTIGDLAAIDYKYVKDTYNKHQLMLWCFANGIDDSKVKPEKEPAKSIGNSTTLPSNITDKAHAYPVLKKLSKSVSERLNKKKLKAGTICVNIKYDNFNSVSKQAPLTPDTNNEAVLFKESCSLFNALWNGGPIRLLGVSTTKFSDEGAPKQLDLFSYQKELQKDIRKEKLEEMLKNVRSRFGENSVKKGSL